VATRTIAPNYLAVLLMTLPTPDKFHQEQNTTLVQAQGWHPRHRHTARPQRTGVRTRRRRPTLHRHRGARRRAVHHRVPLFVGVDVSAQIATPRQNIRDLKIGESGYDLVIDASNGPARGACSERLSALKGDFRHGWMRGSLRPDHFEHRADVGVVAAIAGAHDRLRGGGVEEAVLQEFAADMHADHLPERQPVVHRLAV
jgi:hypothetical protein